MIAAPKIYAHPGPVNAEIRVTDEIIGVQFELTFNPSSADVVSVTYPSGGGFSNEPEPGTIRISMAQATPLDTIVAILHFNATSSTPLEFTEAIGSDTGANDVTLERNNGSIQIGGTMNIRVSWMNNNPVQKEVIDISVYKGPSDTGPWEKMGTVPANVNQFEGTLDPDQGIVWINARARNAVGEGPPLVGSVNTDLPIALENLTIEVI